MERETTLTMEEWRSFRSIIEGKIATLLASQIMVVEAIASNQESKERFIEIITKMNISADSVLTEGPQNIDNESFLYGLDQIKENFRSLLNG